MNLETAKDMATGKAQPAATEEPRQPPARWRMNRAGLLNFWHYDEAEFQLEDGRLILRGANGSGKSVTMQSFLPLVLDGDKRPHRLDPFGSRDRRIEYYLLGDGDRGKNDAIGYLWMEFYHSGTGLYKTIGIGLRARRGGQVGFWGFALEDGRRINRDFWLYDRHLWLETGTRVPLGRRELEEKIGSGGQVVQEQAAYRDLVNRLLFGFPDAESYQDLLQLMIQLRSPKLSKDFKPSAIYEILTDALPPLQEEELRPLSEVLEDMDQIADRLDEIRMHRRDLAKLQHQYDRYNRFMLYTLSARCLERNAEYGKLADAVRRTEAEAAEAARQKAAAEAALAGLEQRMQTARAELDVLENHEAIGKQRELQTTRERLAETDRNLALAGERLARQRARLDDLERRLAAAGEEAERTGREQRDLLQELEAIARDMEFAEHDVYHRYWSRGLPEDEGWRDPWRRDLRRHRDALEAALETARQEREAARAAQELERALGEARKERDEAEREHAAQERFLEREKEQLRDAIVGWRQSLRRLWIDDETVREVFAAISEFGGEHADPERLRAPVRSAYEVQRTALFEARARIAQERKRLEEEKDRLQREKQAWEREREPEPVRPETRRKARAGRPPGTGAPLFAACDFRPHLSEEEKARLEEALERAGLLDAWISPDGRIGALGDDEEELWIVPQPHEIGYTLADLLVPVPPEDSGLSPETVDAALRTFLWDDSESAGQAVELAGDGGMAVIGVSGRFRLGPLAGQVARKERAEFIGKETRRRTRLMEISRLESAIQACNGDIARCDEALRSLAEQEAELERELAQFPDGGRLFKALELLNKAAYRLEALTQQERRAEAKWNEKRAVWREWQQRLVEATARWSGLKREPELQAALKACSEYDRMLSELYSAWRRHREAADTEARCRQEAEETRQSIENEEAEREWLEENRRTLAAQAARLEQLMEELGIADIARQIGQLRQELAGLERERRQTAERLNEIRVREARLSERLSVQTEQLGSLERELDRAVEAWRAEMERRLVGEWAGRWRPDLERDALPKWWKEIVSRHEADFSGQTSETMANALLRQFNEVRMTLAEYVLETEVEQDTGRIVVVSRRDRTNPLPPQVLLDELARDEEEQSRLLSEKDRELYEEIILRSVGKAIRQRIHRAESWVRDMNRLMEQRNTTSGLRLKLEWLPKPAQNEQQLDTERLVELLKRDVHRLHDEEIDQIIAHFRSHIGYARQEAQEEKESLRRHLYDVLDYRKWFQFELRYAKGEQTAFRPLTDSRFNVLSGGEKAMAMYIPLFAATHSRYSDARADAPRIVSLDEAFAGVDEENMRDMFKLLTDMDFDYMMTSQVLWGCYDTVPKLAIYEIYRPKDADWITLFHYRWNGRYREYVEPETYTDGNSNPEAS